jgi:LytS/YehU family sensor histidine kinase
VTATTKSHNTTIIQQLKYPVKPWTLILIFAWLAISALAMNIISDFWVPMLVGAIIIALLVRVALPKR